MRLSWIYLEQYQADLVILLVFSWSMQTRFPTKWVGLVPYLIQLMFWLISRTHPMHLIAGRMVNRDQVCNQSNRLYILHVRSQIHKGWTSKAALLKQYFYFLLNWSVYIILFQKLNTLILTLFCMLSSSFSYLCTPRSCIVLSITAGDLFGNCPCPLWS